MNLHQILKRTLSLVFFTFSYHAYRKALIPLDNIKWILKRTLMQERLLPVNVLRRWKSRINSPIMKNSGAPK